MQIFVTIFVIAFTAGIVPAKSSGVHTDTAPQHGGNEGIEQKFECPFGGAITAIRVHAGHRIDQLEFGCMSSVSMSTIGPFGGDGGSWSTLQCPEGQYVSAFYGRSGKRLDAIGIRCRKQDDMAGEGKRMGMLTGGSGGMSFDDVAHSQNARPMQVIIRSSDEVYAIQIVYTTEPITMKFCTDCSKYHEAWATRHGHGLGTSAIVVCPDDGVITGIRVRAGKRVDSIQFHCTSHFGDTVIGPYGGRGGVSHDSKCPPGSYIGSFHGRSGARIDQIGIRCVKVGKKRAFPKLDGFGEDGGHPFDDEKYEQNDKRPVLIQIWNGDSEVTGIQVKYGNAPIALNCRVTSIEVVNQTIVAQKDGYEVIGVTSGTSCANGTQTLSLAYSESVTEEVGVETQEGGEFNWATSVSVTFTTGVNVLGKSEISFGLSQTLGGSKTWSHTHTKSTSVQVSKSHATTINYKAPGSCVVAGFITRYKIDRNNLPVRYHFACDAGLAPLPKPGTIKLTAKSYGKTDFEDHQFEFNSSTFCTKKIKQCVKAFDVAKNVGKTPEDPDDFETKFKSCFQNNTGKFDNKPF